MVLVREEIARSTAPELRNEPRFVNLDGPQHVDLMAMQGGHTGSWPDERKRCDD